MEINSVFNGVVFPNTGMKLLLSRGAIENIINDYVDRDFSEWVEEECRYCQPNKMCKRHSAIGRAMKATSGVFIGGMYIPYDELIGPYVNKSTLFTWKKDGGSILVIDFPPFVTSYSTTKDDQWIRKVIPFSMGNAPAPHPIEVIQSVNLDAIRSKYRDFEYTVKHPKEDKIESIRIDHSYGEYFWKIKTFSAGAENE